MHIYIGKKVYHKEIYNGKEIMEIVGIRKNTVELEGDYSGGTHNVCQSAWMPIEGLIDANWKLCINKVNGDCPLHNIHCNYPDCERIDKTAKIALTLKNRIMSKEEIVEGNKLIAEFMGLKLIDVWDCGKREFFHAYDWPKEFSSALSPMWVDVGKEMWLKYHQSFDWLMPVVTKINKWHSDTMCEKMDFYLLNQSICSTIEMIWKGCVEFIKWYNSNLPSQNRITQDKKIN